MIIDLRRGEPPLQLPPAAVLIVGGGPVGLSLAMGLAQARVPSLVLEAGGLGPSAPDHLHANSYQPETHALAEWSRTSGLGGTSAVWGGRCTPLDEEDFAPRDWVPFSGWPLPYAALADHIPQASALLEIGPPEFEDPSPAAGGAGGLSFARLARYSPPTHFGRRYRAELERSPWVTVALNARATRILLTADGAVRGVRLLTPSGEERDVAALRVVIAAGGLETPRLLLSSRDVHPAGIGNGAELVGRFYQAHVEGPAGVISFADREAADRYASRPDRHGIAVSRVIALDRDLERRHRLTRLHLRPMRQDIVDPGHGSGGMSAAFLVQRLFPHLYPPNPMERRSLKAWASQPLALYGRHAWNLARDAPGAGRLQVRRIGRRALRARKQPVWSRVDDLNLRFEFHAEQVPNPESRVTLSEGEDGAGVPRLDIRWRATAQDGENVARALQLISARMAQGGARLDGPVPARGDLQPSDGHHIGTARMAAGPDQGVVDASGKVFGVNGLYIAGTAVFPTSGSVGPTLTAVALALRLADTLAGRGP